jgi:NAD(P)H-hydrate epimerase
MTKKRISPAGKSPDNLHTIYAPLPTPEEMTHWDRVCMDSYGPSGAILMENASREAFHVLAKNFGDLKGRSAVVFAGSGNNGGDAFALARQLWNHDVKVMILHTKERDTYSGTTAYHLDLALRLDIPCLYLPDYHLDFLKKVDIVVDGLLGTGFQGDLREEFQTWIQAINKLGTNSFVLSLDIPSGINGTTGSPSPAAVNADVTITFEAAKLGLFLPPSREFVGKLEIKKIGIPKVIPHDLPATHVALTEDILHYLPRPQATMHKGEAGHVLVLGGSVPFTGAPLLSALGAMRSGAGLVTIGSPKTLVHEIKNGWPDIMSLPLGTTEEWNAACAQELQEHISRFHAVVLGPGLGRTPGALEFLTAYMNNPHPNTLYDADALYFLAKDTELMNKVPTTSIVTPHPGEMSRFFHVTSQDINADRAGYVREFTRKFGTNILLKGAATIISDGADPVYISPFATPNLALGGSGDVLSGIIAALMARGVATLMAAQLGVYWHGLCGRILARDFPFRGNLPQEIAHTLPQALKEWNDAHC